MRLGTPNRKGTPLKGDCCPSAFGYINGRVLVVYARHDRELHLLPLTPADLRKLADEIENRAKVEESERAA
jgi:hypothetical protein